MPKLLIRGGVPLRGVIRAKGSKNACLPILAASLLCTECVRLEEAPDLLDVRTMSAVLQSLGAGIEYRPDQEQVIVTAATLNRTEPPAELVQQMRASFLVLGPLLARCRRVGLALPGGCAIGTRPVDLHLKGLSALGAQFTVDNGKIEARAPVLRGARIYLDYPSVGATENILMAATLARGTTVLENAATEPEIVDLAGFLNSMGARVSGAGTTTIRVEGVTRLYGTTYAVIPDRIEAGTLLLAGVITGGEVTVKNVLSEHLKPLLAKLRETGAIVDETIPGVVRCGSGGRPVAVDLKTLPYPGFPTDLQPQFMTLLALARGTALVTETVFENRFRHVESLARMGARIRIEGRHAVIQGRPYLAGAPVNAPDLRASAALVLAALAARGVTEIEGVVHLWRGYNDLEERLRGLGAQIHLIGKPPFEQFRSGQG